MKYYSRWYYPCWGTPWPGPMGVPKVGYPPSRSDRGVPKVGYPPQQGLDLAGVPPLDLAGIPPLGVDRQTDTCQNITFPSYAVGNNTLENETQGSLLIRILQRLNLIESFQLQLLAAYVRGAFKSEKYSLLLCNWYCVCSFLLYYSSKLQ